MSSLLTVSDLTVRFRRGGALRSLLTPVAERHFYALRNVSIEINAGETLGLVGQSGSGKSTLGRTIMGLQAAHTGSVKFDGLELMGLSEKRYRTVRRSLAMIFQDPVASLSPRKTVAQSVIEPFRIHQPKLKHSSQEAARLLKLVGLDESFLSAYPNQLSGGQARRVGIARALALNPRVIIADEPIAGLDVSVQGEILSLLSRLQEELNIAYLFITHNLAIARHVCDRLAILYGSSLVEVGLTEELLNSPAHPYSEMLLRASPNADPLDKRKGLPSQQENFPADDENACVFRQNCPISQDVCHNTTPPYRRITETHKSKCHFPLEKVEG